ncbi:hypothetical protein AOQ84DRAFT_295130 [Glonium stellatum]|uniref:N-acetyltransferase domain-containing protein n=1 Tax=Glonium stellatum TaxID=574774 RepID=A0A8E2JRY5_9PEZI|nr:hypothetical protein AOQ84DRAFT_295130 [Glonium stellatum]
MAVTSASIVHPWPRSPALDPLQISIRQGSIVDLDAMLDIGLAAFPLDPQWDYRFPHRWTYPRDTRKFTRMRYREFLEGGNGRWVVLFAECIDPENPLRLKIMAFSVWEIINISNQMFQRAAQDNQTPPPESQHDQSRRDGDPRRMRAWTDTLASSRRVLFDRYYGTRHFQLQILATHPEHQRRGAGSSLCRWGMQLAKERNMAISVFASPMGKQLYRHLGFHSLASVTIKVQEEDDYVILEAMAYIPHYTQRPQGEVC